MQAWPESRKLHSFQVEGDWVRENELYLFDTKKNLRRLADEKIQLISRLPRNSLSTVCRKVTLTNTCLLETAYRNCFMRTCFEKRSACIKMHTKGRRSSAKKVWNLSRTQPSPDEVLHEINIRIIPFDLLRIEIPRSSSIYKEHTQASGIFVGFWELSKYLQMICSHTYSIYIHR